MDELARLVANARALLEEGYYDVRGASAGAPSFVEALASRSPPSKLIAEIKYTSPTMASGKTSDEFDALLDRLLAARPLGLSVLAEPRIFGGSLGFVRKASGKGLPVLMKDIVIDETQIEAARSCGASAVLIIQTLVTRGLLDRPVQELIDAAHERDLDVVLEVHSQEDWDAGVQTDADILGINNRDLVTMHVDTGTTPALLSARPKDRPVIAMSGIDRRDQVEAMLRAGADAVLVGTSIMSHDDPGKKLEELSHG